MSYVKRARAGRFTEAQKRVQLAVTEVAEEAARLVQAEVVQRVPVRTGKLRAFFASGEAIAPLRNGHGYRFGLITAALRKNAHYGTFVEYGTKGYSKGDTRVTRVGKDGKTRTKKIKRTIPARPAQPFFRPGVEAARERVKSLIANATKDALKD